MELKANHDGEIPFFGDNQKMNPRPEFPRSQKSHCKIKEENTPISLHSKMFSVLTGIGKKGKTKAVLGD